MRWLVFSFALPFLAVAVPATPQDSRPAGPPGVKAYDLGRNGAAKVAASLVLPGERASSAWTSRQATGIVFFGESLANAAVALRIPRDSFTSREAGAATRPALLGGDAARPSDILFESTMVTAIEGAAARLPDAGGPRRHRVRGKLTIGGITREVVLEGELLEIEVPGGRERGFVGEVLSVRLSGAVLASDFGLGTPDRRGREEPASLRLDAFAMTNDRPQRERAAALRDALRAPAPESRPAASRAAGDGR